MAPYPKTVTRRQILTAIRTENLAQGQWVQNPYDTSGTCSVCAVGAVLRKSGVKPILIKKYGDALLQLGACSPASVTCNVNVEREIQGQLDAGLYMNALSLKFETLVYDFATMPPVRRRLAAWVKANLPTVVKL